MRKCGRPALRSNEVFEPGNGQNGVFLWVVSDLESITDQPTVDCSYYVHTPPALAFKIPAVGTRKHSPVSSPQAALPSRHPDGKDARARAGDMPGGSF
jgi:hypothetical protein